VGGRDRLRVVPDARAADRGEVPGEGDRRSAAGVAPGGGGHALLRRRSDQSGRAGRTPPQPLVP